MKHKFKLGQRVIIVRSDYLGSYAGDTGIIVKLWDNGNYGVSTWKSECLCFNPSDLEILK